MPTIEPVYHIALFEHERDDIPKCVVITWDELVAELSSFRTTECKETTCIGHHCKQKYGEAWSPTDYGDPDEPERLDVNVKAITFAVFDLDGEAVDPKNNATPERMADLAGAIAGLRYICHATHAKGNYRLILALDKPVPVDKWPRVWNLIRNHYQIPADPTCSNPSRIYFFPSKPWGRGEGEVYTGEGSPLDVAWLDELYKEAKPEAARALPSPPQEPARPILPEVENGGKFFEPVDLQAVRKKLEGLRSKKSAELMRRVLNAEPLAKTGERDNTVNAAASVIGAAVDISPEVAVEIMRPSISQMDCEPEGLQYWLDKAHGSFQRAVKRRVAKDAREAKTNASLRRVIEKHAKESKSEEDLEPEGDELPDGVSEEWDLKLLRAEDEDGEPGKLKPCGANVNLILSNADEWKGNIAFDEIKKEITVLGGPLVNTPKASLHIDAMNWLAQSEWGISLKSRDVGEQLLSVALKNPINPLQDYLNSCKLKWLETSKPGIDNFFMEYLGAHGNADYLKAISRRWFIGAVARAIRPGSFVRTVLVLEGAQEAGKSSALRILGGAWFSDTKIDIGSKDGRMAASRFWIIEMAELASMKRVDRETLKNFISNTHDDIRLPYGASIESFPRRCILVGTTNEDNYLDDVTGNTRYWPVRVGRIDLDGIREARDLLWGEAVQALEEGEHWWFEKEDEWLFRLQASEARERETQSDLLEPILNWFLQIPSDRRPEFSSVDEIATRALMMTVDRIDARTRMNIGKAMHQLGFTKKRLSVAGVRVWRFGISDELKNLPQESKPRPGHLQVVSRTLAPKE